MATLSGKLGAVYVQTDASSVTFTTLATTDVGGTHTVYRVTDRTKSYWDITAAVTVKVNTVTVTTGFTVEHAGGYVRFTTPLLGSDTVTVTGKYFVVSEMLGFFNWKLDTQVSLQDVTTFADSGWKVSIPTLEEFKVSASKYFLTDAAVIHGEDDDITKLIGSNIIVALFVDDSASLRRYEGYVTIVSDGISLDVEGIVQESIEMMGTGAVYYREG